VEDDAQRPGALNSWLKRNLNWLVLAVGFTFFVFPHISPFEGLNHQLQFLQRFSEWTLRKLENLFADYGYYVVFLGVLLENSMFLGFLVPGSIILILGGLSAENGSINLFYVIGLAIVATIIGDTISYMVGRLGWTRAIERTSAGGAIEKVRGSMESNSTWIILAYHWAGYSRAVGPLAAGLFRIPYRKWAPLDYVGGAAWAIGFTMIGVVLGLFGVEFGDTKTMVRLIELMFFGLIVAVIALTWYQASKVADGDGGGPAPSPRGGRPAHVVIPVDED
jgi:membrane-associated protein